ncbi:MAG: serine/threonine-protein phosphatase [Methanobrevibacter sp.]|nr:serine/threonine-protein phosphatase [Candidatus Methanovirga basalitermitum]
MELYIDDLKRIRIEREKIRAEIFFSSIIQKDMIPNSFPIFPDKLDEFDIHAIYNPAQSIGGDLYDCFLIDNDHLAIIIGDVTGKGIPASLLMIKVMILIKDQLLIGLSPSKALNITNERVAVNNELQMFVTSWVGILKISSGKLTYVNAGHDSPFISHNYSDYIVLDEKHSIVIGLNENVEYLQHEAIMSEHDRLYLYTDGIIEAINKDNEQFSKYRLLNVLNKINTLTLKN